MLILKISNQFKKDIKLAKKQNRDLKKLENVINALQSKEKLDRKFKDHKLTGNFSDCRECHITPDWLLIYMMNEKELVLVRIGSHSDLFV